MKGLLRFIYFIFTLLLLAACNSTKYVGEGEYLLARVRIESDENNYKDNDLKSYIRQQPNFKVFGLAKWQLFVYNWSGPDENKWVNKQLRRMGEAPVILDTMLVEQSTQELERFFINKGYINAEVTATIDTVSRKKAVVTYQVVANEPYRIRNYSMNIDDPRIDRIAHFQPQPRSRFFSTFRTNPEEFAPLVKEGTLFDRDILDQERQRLTSILRRRGYYAFNKDYFAYYADSAFRQNIVDLEMYLRPYRYINPAGVVTDTIHPRYYIKDVTIITDHDPLAIGTDPEHISPADTLKYGATHILYGVNGRSIRPGVLLRSNYILPGRLFNERNVEQTYSAFSTLRALRNVNIRFTEVMENDTMKLHTTIYTAPAKTQGFGVDVEGTNSAGDFGFASSLNYQHRNLFKGSELFSARVRGAYEALTNKNNDGTRSNYWEFGAETTLNFPSFLFPFVTNDFRRSVRTSTELRLSYNYQTRPDYKRALLSGGLNYIWRDRLNASARHVFKLMDIDYVYIPYLNPVFEDRLSNFIKLYNFTEQFVLGTGYSYSFTNYSPFGQLRNTHSFRLSYEMAGNLLYGISKLSKAEKNEQGLYEFLGANYAQFVKMDVDFSKNYVVDFRNRIAFHVGVGVGYPYGNSKLLPFERSYFSGGANSVRGWSVRSLGPGSMPVTDSTTYADQIGDIRLDLSVEYRTKLFWKFELAAYIDGGNIWTMHKNADRPDGNFDFFRFYREIAFSYGLGLRLDFDFFLIRLDSGLKAYNPQAPKSERWPLLHPNLKDNFALHFAVGYPF
ncbi:MAG: BamA/TamA family outer membrane protein [Tannerellaceae bacterium]|nr:BamA/TamA family outer membrane protein [Tannerellaceae bacterium]